MQAARRLAATLTGRPVAVRGGREDAEPHIRALERAVAAYVATHGGARGHVALGAMVATRVQSALWADGEQGYPAPVVDVVVEIARRAVDDALVD